MHAHNTTYVHDTYIHGAGHNGPTVLGSMGLDSISSLCHSNLGVVY